VADDFYDFDYKYNIMTYGKEEMNKNSFLCLS